MEMEKDECPVVKVDGFVEKGKQFDIDIVVPEDERNVIYGILRNRKRETIEDAVIKLIEIVKEHGKKERRPVSHTFTDKNGEFVFGPLCPDREYEIQIWSDRVKHVKVCEECHMEKKDCLKGIRLEDCDDKKDPYEPQYPYPCKK